MITPIELSKLKPHEETDPHNLERVVAALQHGTLLNDHPILVDEQSYVILDGHHRYEASLELGLKIVPCILVDYFSEEIQLESRRPDLNVTKEEVIERALAGKLYPPKTTKHIFENRLYERSNAQI